MTGYATSYEELRKEFLALPNAEARLDWMATLPQDSPFFTRKLEAGEFFEMETRLGLLGSLRATP